MWRIVLLIILCVLGFMACAAESSSPRKRDDSPDCRFVREQVPCHDPEENRSYPKGKRAGEEEELSLPPLILDPDTVPI